MTKEIKYPYKTGEIDVFGDEVWVYGPDPYANEEDYFDNKNDPRKSNNMKGLRDISDYQLTFEEYVLKHGVSSGKKKLAQKQWIKAIIIAHESGLYEQDLMSGKMSAVMVQDQLNEAGIAIPADIIRIIKEEHEQLTSEHKAVLESKNVEIETIKASIPEISAKEIKVEYTKQEVIDTVEGLKILAESLSGREKSNIEDTIAGLEILLEDMPDKMERGGYALYKDGNIINEYY